MGKVIRILVNGDAAIAAPLNKLELKMTPTLPVFASQVLSNVIRGYTSPDQFPAELTALADPGHFKTSDIGLVSHEGGGVDGVDVERCRRLSDIGLVSHEVDVLALISYSKRMSAVV